jgi:hypothetical protein
MAFATETSELPHIEIKPEALVSLPVGVISPLWGFYATAALSGVAYWWMTQWARPVNLEALFGASAALPVTATVSNAVEATVEALSPPELPQTPVGGEAAPISPVAAVEAATEAGTAPVVAAANAVEAKLEEAVAAPPSVAKESPAPAPEPRSVAPKAKAAPPEQPRSI